MPGPTLSAFDLRKIDTGLSSFPKVGPKRAGRAIVERRARRATLAFAGATSALPKIVTPEYLASLSRMRLDVNEDSSGA